MRAGLRQQPANTSGDARAGAGAADVEVLRECVRGALPGASASKLFPALLEQADWSRVLWHGRTHRGLLFLREALSALEAAQRPPALWAQLTQLHEVNQFRAMERGRELCLIQDIFDQAGITAIAMHGWAFAQRYYSNPSLRDVGATTAFLVDPADRPAAEKALAAAGYAFDDDLLRLVDARRSRVVLHHGLCGDSSARSFPLAQIRARAEAFAVGGRTLPLLSARDWLFRFCWQGAQASRPDLLLNFDLALVALRQPSSDWPEILDEARRADLELTVLLSLCTCREVLGLALPDAVLARLRKERGVEARAKALARTLTQPGDDNRWSQLRLRLVLQKSWVAKLQVLSRAVRAALRPARLPAAETELACIGRFAPTPLPVVRAMLRCAEAGPDDVVYDLGCGDGRVVITAAKEFGARGVGIDIDPQSIETARAAASSRGVADRVTLSRADVLHAPLAGATIVFIYLQGFAYPALRKKLERELPRGTRVVSHNFVFPNWPPEKAEIVRSDRLAASHIYLWRT